MGGIFGDLFEGVETAQGGQRGSYFPYADAVYRVKITKVKAFETRKIGKAFTVDFEVLESGHKDVVVGVTKNYFTSDGKVERNVFLGNVADFMRAAMSCWYFQKQDGEIVTPLEVALTKELVDEASDENGDQPLAGVEMVIETIATKTKAKTDFTAMKWHCEHLHAD